MRVFWQLSWRDVQAAAAFEWTLAWRRRRQRLTMIVGMLPLVVALLLVALKMVGIVPMLAVDILPSVLALGYIPVFVVVIPLLLGTSLIGREAEGGTLAYLFVRPLSRVSLLLGKFVGAWGVACLLLTGSLVLVNLLLLASDGFRDAWFALRILPLNLLVLCIGALAYAALFTAVGLLTSRPALVGLFVAFVWELGIPFLPGTLRNFTIRHHLVGLLAADSMPSYVRLTIQPPEPLVAIAWLSLGVFVWLSLSMWIFSRRDFP